MKNKNIWILAALLALAFILGAFVIRDIIKSDPNPEGLISPNLETAPIISPSRDSAAEDDGDIFREETPLGIRVPEVNEVVPPAQRDVIAVPDIVAPAAPGSLSNFRNFNISASGGKFVPEIVSAYLGDTVKINFTALDGDYDIVFPSYNMSQTAKQGETKILQFQALAEGSFIYYCESCGGPEGGAKGNIIIVER